MAIEIGGVRVMMSTNAGEFTRGTKKIGREYQTLGRRISDISSQINRASIFINTGIMAAQRFANAAAGIFRVASSFEAGMSNVATLIDTSTESLERMSAEVLKIGADTPVTIAELTTGLYDLRSAGTSAEDAMGRLGGSARLAVAGLGTTQEAVDLVTSSINAFGLEGQDADDVFNLIFKTVKNGKTTISQLAQGFGAVAGTVANAGIELDDYLASVAALTTTGLPAAQAHTQIRAAIAGLLRETKESKALFDALGVKTFKQLVTQSGSVVTAFQRIVRATQSNDAQLIKLLGSVEAYNAVIGLSGSQNKAYLDTINSMNDGTDAVTEAFDKQNKTLNSTLQRLRNNIEAVATSIGSALAPTLASISDSVANVARAFTELDPETQQLIARIIAIVGVVTPAVIALGFFANALASLIPVFAAIGAAMAALGAGFLAFLAPAGPIGLFIIAASAAVTAWNIFRDDILAIWNAVASFIGDKIEEIIGKMKRFATSISEAFSLIKEGEFTEAWKRLNASVDETNRNVSEHTKTVQGMAQAWTTVIEKVPGQFKDGFVVPMGESTSELAKVIEKQHNQALRDAKRIIKDIQTPGEALIEQQNRIKAAFDAGGLSAAQYATAMQRSAYISQNAYAGMASDIVGSLQNVFGQSKAFATAQAIINTYEGVTKALAAYPPPFNFAAAAAVLASGLAQVQQIRSTNKGSTGGGGGGVSGGSTSAEQPSQQQSVFIDLQGDNFSRESVRGLIGQINEAVSDGVELVVTTS